MSGTSLQGNSRPATHPVEEETVSSETALSQTQEDAILQEYHHLQDAMDQETARLRSEIRRSPCPANCYDCCRNTATLLLGEIEARDIRRGLKALPQPLRIAIRRKAEQAVRKLKDRGYERDAVSAVSTDAVNAIRGTPEAECPMLIGGVCAIYEHRPVICRIWGYPLINNGEVTCCRKTFIGMREQVAPIDYDHYWRASRKLSVALGNKRKTPNCFLVLDLLDSLEASDGLEKEEQR